MLTEAQVLEHVETDLPSAALGRVIAAAYGEIEDFAGPTGAIRESHIDPLPRVLFTGYPVDTISEVVEIGVDGTETTVPPAEYRLRGAYEVVNTTGKGWADEVRVTYQRADDSAVRDEVAIELIRMIVEHRAPVDEATGGTAGYRANYAGMEQRKREAMARLNRRRAVVA